MDRIELEQDYFTKYFNDIDDNDMPYIELHYDQQQQQRLSQRLSQLSMTNQTDDDDGDNSIPKYLQTELIKITSPIYHKIEVVDHKVIVIDDRSIHVSLLTIEYLFPIFVFQCQSIFNVFKSIQINIYI
ncbi:unnamed protein product [Rotaria sp. Silwood2]|nr:unnamed protein product [Rotaria sp. Silwood2]